MYVSWLTLYGLPGWWPQEVAKANLVMALKRSLPVPPAVSEWVGCLLGVSFDPLGPLSSSCLSVWLFRFMLLTEGIRFGMPSSEFAMMFFWRLCLFRSLDRGA